LVLGHRLLITFETIAQLILFLQIHASASVTPLSNRIPLMTVWLSVQTPY